MIGAIGIRPEVPCEGSGPCKGLVMGPGTDPATDPATAALLEFACPRCRAQVSERYYGPCVPCRDALVASLGGEARDVEVAAYEPKLNVTPNAVASRE